MSEETDFDLSEWEQTSTKKMLSFSFGYLLVFTMISQFNTWVFYFYEVELGLPVVLLGLAFAIFAVWNMINDPLVGYLTDRPFKWSRKWGMRFPWMMIGVIPYLIFWWLLFAVPNSLVENSDPWPLFWYLILVTCLFDTFYSLFSTHINAGFTMYFRTDAERRRSSAINTTVPQIIALFLGFIVPLVYVYGNRDSMILAQGLVVLMLLICVVIFIPGARESEGMKEAFLRGYEEKERDSYIKTMKAAFKRKNFIATTIILALMTLSDVTYLTAGPYFMKDVLGLPIYNMTFTRLAWFIGYICFIPFWSNISKKYGHAKTMKLSILLIALVYLNALWVSTLTQAIITTFIGGFVAGAFWVTIGPTNADVYDESTVDTGKHQEAAYEGIRTFFYRTAYIGTAAIIVIVHLATGYNPDPNAVQTPLAVWGVRIHRGLIPSLINFIAFIIMTIWYDLYKEKRATIQKKLREMGL